MTIDSNLNSVHGFIELFIRLLYQLPGNERIFFLVDEFDQIYSNVLSDENWDTFMGDAIILKNRIDKALSVLHKADSLIVTLYYIEEQSIDEICLILEMNRSVVKTRLHRARIKLKELLRSKINSNE